jgi:hypothetical protein
MRAREFMTETSNLAYRWTSVTKALSGISRDVIPAGRWAHFINGQMLKGVSWSKDKNRWQHGEGANVCFVIDMSKITNTVHSINGQRTYHQTRAEIDPIHDPNAWKDFEGQPDDEEFAVGAIEGLRNALVGVFTSDDTVRTACEKSGIRVLESI